MESFCDLPLLEFRLVDDIVLSEVIPRLETGAGGFMTMEERQSVEEAQEREGKSAAVSKIISVLKKKDREAISKFCDILVQSGNDTLGEALKKDADSWVNNTVCAAKPQNTDSKLKKELLRNWTQIGKCQKVIKVKSGVKVDRVAIKGSLLAAAVVSASAPKAFIQVMTVEGKMVKFIGKGQLGPGVDGVTFSQDGDLLVSDSMSCEVRMFQHDGRYLGVVGGCPFSGPSGIAISSDGQIYICDSIGYRVSVHDKKGVFLFTFIPADKNYLWNPYPVDISINNSDILYIVDESNMKVCIHSKDGAFMDSFGTKYSPSCIAATGCGHLVVGCRNSRVLVYMISGELVAEFAVDQVKTITGVSVDSSGLVYIVGGGNSIVVY